MSDLSERDPGLDPGERTRRAQGRKIMHQTDFHFQPSKQYIFLLVTLLMMSVGMVIFFISPILLKIAIFSLLMGYVKYLLQDAALKNPNSILRIKKEKDQWRVETNKGIYSAKLHGESIISAYLCVLRFQVKNRYLSAIVLKDSLKLAEDYRRLQVVMRW